MAKNDERIARLKDSFDIFDEDGSGELSVDEVMTILTRMSGGAPLTEDDAKEFIAEVTLSHVAPRLKLAKSSRRGQFGSGPGVPLRACHPHTCPPYTWL